MLCRTAEHLVYAVMPPRFIPTSDSVVYNDSIFDRNTQENHVFARFLVSSSQSFMGLPQLTSVVSVIFLQYNEGNNLDFKGWQMQKESG